MDPAARSQFAEMAECPIGATATQASQAFTDVGVEEAVNDHFRGLDANHDGVISKFEFEQAVEEMQEAEEAEEQGEKKKTNLEKKLEEEAAEEKHWITWDSIQRRVKRNRWLVLTTSEDLTVKLWDLDGKPISHQKRGEPPEPKCRATFTGIHEDAVRVAIVDMEARRAITGAADGTLSLWDLEVGESKNCFLTGKFGAITCIDADFSRQKAITGSKIGILCVWHSERMSLINEIRGHDGARIVLVKADFEQGRAITGATDGRCRSWDIENGQCQGTFDLHEGPLSIAVVDFDTGRVISGDDDGKMHLWNLEKREAIAELEGHQDRINVIRADIDSGLCVSCSNDETAKVFEIGSGRCRGTLEGHEAAVRDAAVDFETWVAVTCSDDGTIRIWSLESYECTGLLGRSLTFRPTRAPSGSGAFDGTIEYGVQWPGHLGRVHHIRARFDREPRMLVSTSADYSLRLWNLDTLECEELLCSHSGRITTLVP